MNATVETNATQPVDRMHDRAPSERAEVAIASLSRSSVSVAPIA